MIRGIDWGGYDYSLPAADLAKAGVRFFICKGGQPGTKRLLKLFRDAGCVVGTYYWNDPTISPALQILTFSQLIRDENPDFISLDIEQYWADWQEWEDNLKKGTKITKFLTDEQISNNAYAVRTGLRQAFPDKYYLNYSAKWFIEGYSQSLKKWIYQDPCWFASYFDLGQEWYDITWDQIKSMPPVDARPVLPPGATSWQMWQYSSRQVPPGLQFPLDWNVFYGTEDQLRGAKENTTMGVYKSSVPMASRAWFPMVSDEDKNLDIASICNSADAIMMRMVTQATPDMNIRKDAAFQTWAGRATKPVLGCIVMDQDLFWKKEIYLPDFQDTAKRNMWNNETFKGIIEQWRINPPSSAEWANKKLNIAANDGGWVKLNGLVLYMSTMSGHSDIGGSWQTAIMDDLLKPLTTLMAGNYIPKVPIYVMASNDWFRKYAGNDEWKLKDRIANGQVAGAGVMRVWGQEEYGLITEQAPMSAPATLAKVRTYLPADSYSLPFTYEGVNYQFFVYTYNRLMASDAFYSGTTVTPLTAAVWCDTPEAMYKSLGWEKTGDNPPPSNPPSESPVTGSEPTLTDLAARVVALETWAKKFPAFGA